MNVFTGTRTLHRVNQTGICHIYSTHLFHETVGGSFSVFIWYKQRSSFWIPNPNASLLYKCHLYFSFHASLFFPIVYSLQLIRYFLPITDPCFNVYNARLSCLIRLIPVVAVHAQSFNMLCFALERAISTAFSQRYERISRPYLAIFFVILSIISVLVMDLVCYFLPISENSYVAGLTVRQGDNRSTFQYAVNICLFVELMTITVFMLTYLINMKKEKDGDLGNKYQVSENKKIIRVLFPCFLLHFILNIFGYFFLTIFPFILKDSDTLTTTWFTELIGQAQNYGLFMPWVLVFSMRKRYQVESQDAAQATQAHFDNLRRIFNAE